MNRPRLIPILTAALLLCGVGNARSMDIYLWLDGIPGGSTAAAYTNWIDCERAQFLLLNIAPGQPTVHWGLQILKPVDPATPRLNRHVYTQDVIPRGKVEFLESTGFKNRFYEITVSNVTVSTIFTLTDTNPPVTAKDAVFLNYELIQWTYTEFDGDGDPTDTTDTYWDIPLQDGGWSTNDTDGDGTPDMHDRDDDNDGMPDAYEAGNCTDMKVHDAAGDPDGDGVNSLNEFKAGTSSCDSNDFFRVTFYKPIDSNQARLTWTSKAGKKYRLYSSINPTGTYTAWPGVIDSAGDGTTSTNIPLLPGWAYWHVKVEE